MVRARQLVLNLYEEQQIRPYLYKTPAELSDFNSLFRSVQFQFFTPRETG